MVVAVSHSFVRPWEIPLNTRTPTSRSFASLPSSVAKYPSPHHHRCYRTPNSLTNARFCRIIHSLSPLFSSGITSKHGFYLRARAPLCFHSRLFQQCQGKKVCLLVFDCRTVTSEVYCRQTITKTRTVPPSRSFDTGASRYRWITQQSQLF